MRATNLAGDRQASSARVLIVDDHHAFADLLAGALDAEPDFLVLGTAASADEALEQAALLRPNMVLMDIRLGTDDGLATAGRIRALLPDAVVVIVSAYVDSESISCATRIGASAFAPKEGSLSAMLQILRAARGQTQQAESMALVDEPSSEAPIVLLTLREREVLALMGQGRSPAQVARALGISLHTSRDYVKSIHAKLDARSQLEAVIKALRLGLIDPLQ